MDQSQILPLVLDSIDLQWYHNMDSLGGIGVAAGAFDDLICMRDSHRGDRNQIKQKKRTLLN